ncbi:MAG: hypothetical protein AUK47_03875 [Deltaproteobacteria bacterium CG2_30_63_29]|nr:MAG: hypothetical protein AUK47_03875 [Deltaproteobacteria bacterium CG2_30_63_29]
MMTLWFEVLSIRTRVQRSSWWLIAMLPLMFGCVEPEADEADVASNAEQSALRVAEGGLSAASNAPQVPEFKQVWDFPGYEYLAPPANVLSELHDRLAQPLPEPAGRAQQQQAFLDAWKDQREILRAQGVNGQALQAERARFKEAYYQQ